MKSRTNTFKFLVIGVGTADIADWALSGMLFAIDMCRNWCGSASTLTVSGIHARDFTHGILVHYQFSQPVQWFWIYSYSAECVYVLLVIDDCRKWCFYDPHFTSVALPATGLLPTSKSFVSQNTCRGRPVGFLALYNLTKTIDPTLTEWWP